MREDDVVTALVTHRLVEVQKAFVEGLDAYCTYRNKLEFILGFICTIAGFIIGVWTTLTVLHR